MQIEVKNLTKQFKTKGKRTKLLFHEKENFTAVDNISFNIDKGNIVGFIGPNGAGKSTTIKMLTGIISKTNGEISINGLDPLDYRLKLNGHFTKYKSPQAQFVYNMKQMNRAISILSSPFFHWRSNKYSNRIL